MRMCIVLTITIFTQGKKKQKAASDEDAVVSEEEVKAEEVKHGCSDWNFEEFDLSVQLQVNDLTYNWYNVIIDQFKI